MRSILVDAGPLIALFDSGDRYHRQSLTFINSVPNTILITNLPVLSEAMANLDFSIEAQIAALSWSTRTMRIDSATADDFPRIAAIMDKYRDLPADFADASLVALAERLGTLEVATVDKDFDVYRTKSKGRFTNLFFER